MSGALTQDRGVTCTLRVSEKSMTANFRDELVSLLPRLRAFALTLTNDLHEADDLVQQSCEKALRKQNQWQPGTRLDSWMYRIIQNQHIDTLRGRKRRGEQAPEAALTMLADPSSSDRAEHENMLTKLSKVIEQLPSEQRSVMMLVAVEEYSYSEAAQILNIPAGTVMSRLARARRKIISMLEEPPITTVVGH